MSKRAKVITGIVVAAIVIAAVGGAGGNKEEAVVESNTTQKEVKSEPKNETTDTVTDAQEATSAVEEKETEEPEAAEPVVEERADSLLYGELLDVVENDGVVVIKAKIKSSSDSKNTINQNYYNIEDYIKNHDMAGVTEIQYWAVADMSNGSEDKVISFTIPADLIARISGGKFAANQMGDYVEELWVHPSLR